MGANVTIFRCVIRIVSTNKQNSKFSIYNRIVWTISTNLNKIKFAYAQTYKFRCNVN